MRVLIIGSGGREHALGWKIAQSPLLEQLYFAPGNPGTEGLGMNVALGSHDRVIDFCRQNQVDLVIVGPEKDLVMGIADRLAEAGIACFGPSRDAAQLEGSKAFAKDLMSKIGIPTARYGSFTTYEKALAYVEVCEMPVVVKADGLAAGKGVTICENRDQAVAAIREAMLDKRFGDAGTQVVLEEFLKGTEASFHVICDGTRFLALPSAQDHKALNDGNTGPNTGGMGTFSPSPTVTAEVASDVIDRVARPLFEMLEEDGTPFRGVLFVGLMLTADGPKVLEFNVRFGDPETQVIMPRIKSDLLPILRDAALGRLQVSDLETSEDASVCVVLTADGYPSAPRKGDRISGLSLSMDRGVVFHAGTRREGDALVTAGGRVVGVTSWGRDLEAAREGAYTAALRIVFEGKYYRKDIGLEI